MGARTAEVKGGLLGMERLQALLKTDAIIYEFGPFRLDVSEYSLYCNGQFIPLTSRLFNLLLFLVENSGHLVTKDEILREVWQGRIVEENNLTVGIWALRKAIGGGENEHQYIKTISSRGYRFCANVREISHPES